MSKPKSEKNIIIPESFLKELLTPSEVRMLKNRWQIVSLLQEGLSIRNVAKQAKVGTDTVVRVKRMVDKNDFEDKLNSTQNLKTPWIFGKNEDQ